MTKFLLDANLSPETRLYLERVLELDVIDLLSEHLGTLNDTEVVALAKEQDRVIVTFDLDFGEIYHLRELGNIGVIILRLEDQTVEAVNETLRRVLGGDLAGVDLRRSLVVVEDKRIRISRPS